MINVTSGQYNADDWNKMVIQATHSDTELNHKHIYRVIYPDGNCNLELKTGQEVKKHFETYGSWNSNCRKMYLSDVINITRITALSRPVKPELKEPLNSALDYMAARAEEKYNSGIMGVLRKISSQFFNLFTNDSVSLFGMPKTNVCLEISEIGKKNKLPYFIGDDAKFARLVAKEL